MKEKAMKTGRSVRCAALAAGLVCGIGAGPVTASAGGAGPDGVIRLLTFEKLRTLDCMGEWNTNLATGEVFVDMRNAMLDPANFGPGGVVDREIQILTVPEIDASQLAGTDVVVLSILQVPATACETRELRAFVEQGGGLFVFENNAARVYGPLFGAVGLNDGNGGTGVFVNHAVTTGPFGDVSGSSYVLALHKHFDTLGPDGTALLADGDGPVAAAFEVGGGRAVLICDEEWASSVLLLGCGIDASDMTAARSFFLNAVAWVTPAEGFAYDPVDWPACPADLIEDCVLDFFDVQAFLAAFASGSTVADFNGDGLLDFFDVQAFLNSFASGCV
jgi:hypothetical protein